jgi:signal transduction histidine kinase/CheY-like chemotaxis protein
VRTKGLIAVAIPLAALIFTNSASLVLLSSERADRTAATAAFNLVRAADRVLTDALNAETGVRGYAATRDQVFLQPYRDALARIGGDLKALQSAAIAEGDTGIERTVSAAATVVFGGLAQLRAQVSSGVTSKAMIQPLATGKLHMDALRRLVVGLIRGPAAEMAARNSAITAQEMASGILHVVGLALGLLAGLAGVVLFTLGISRRLGAAAANANRIGEGQPLHEVTPARDDLGRLNDALVRADELLASRSAELTTARDEALQATRAKNAFLSSTSHELRTPLNSILGFAQLLQISDLNDEDSDSVERILAAGRHLLDLINELIDIARIESGELSISLEPVSVQPLIEEACQLMSPLAAERSIRLSNDCASPALAVHADRQRFSQVLVNLISNAVKYNRRGGTITVTCQDRGPEQAGIVIADTGHGISPDDLERIFVPFERLGAEQTETEGTGIGLPLARALTLAMGGQLTVASTVGRGSAFTITLPRAPDMAASAPHRAMPLAVTTPHARAGTALGVLYIEDNPANVEVVSRFLKNRPNTALHAVSSGQAGLDYAAREVPDVILLDLHLPGLPGEHVLKELKAEPATAAIPVAVLSAEASPGTIRRLLAAGAHTYLTKPLVLADLDRLLSSLTDPVAGPGS